MTNKDELRVTKILQGMEFPATKDQIVEFAQTREVDAKTQRALSALADREYANKDDVEQAVPQRPEQAI